MTAPDEYDEQGKAFDKRYSLGELLGKGASSSAYKAKDLLLERDVVVKVIHAHLLTSELAVQRFKSEAALCSSLSHPAIARVYNSGVTADGRLYLVMDYIEGKTLAEILAEESKLSLPDFFSCFSDLLGGVEHAHEHKIVHRDIKPSNIIVKRENGVMNAILIDFGLAKSIEAEAQSSTNTGLFLGSAGYMSPEQCRAEKSIDQRSDIYSIGCVMSEALIGAAPFSGGTDLEVMSRHLEITQKRLGFLKKLPPSLAKLIKKCLERDAQNRYQNLVELKRDFEACKVSKDCLKLSINETHQNHSLTVAVLAVFILCAGVSYYVSSNKNGRTSSSPKLADVLPNRGVPKANSKLPIRIEDLGKHLDEMNQKSTKSNQDADLALELINSWEKRYGTQFDVPTHSSLQAMRVKQLCMLGRMDEAKVIVEELLASSFYLQSANALYSYMSRLIELRRFTEGITVYEKFEKKFPEIQRVDFQKVIILGLLGDCYMGLGRYKMAKLEYSKSRKTLLLLEDSKLINDDAIAGTARILAACIALRDERGIDECVASIDKFFKGNEINRAKADLALTRIFASNSFRERMITHAQKSRFVFKKNSMLRELQEVDRYLANEFLVSKKYKEAQELEEEIFSLAPNVKDKVCSLTMLSLNAYQRGDKALESKYSSDALNLAQKALDNFSSGNRSQSRFDCEDAYQVAISRKVDMESEDFKYIRALATTDDALRLYGKQFPEIGLFLYRKRVALTNNLGLSNVELLSEQLKAIESLIKEMQKQPVSSKQNSYILEGKAEITRLKEQLFMLQNNLKMSALVAKAFLDEFQNDIQAEPYLVEQAYIYCYKLLELKQYSDLKTFLDANHYLMMNVKMADIADWTNKTSSFVLFQISVQNYAAAELASLECISALRAIQPENRWLQSRYYILLAKIYSKTNQAEKRKQCLLDLQEIGRS